VTRDEAITELRAAGLSDADALVVTEHLAAADTAGRTGHGLSRIPWLVELLGSTRDPAGRPERVEQAAGFERWHGNRALGYVTLAAICEGIVAEPPERARLVVAESCFPTGVLGAWARSLAEAGLAAVVTATSPRRLPHPDGGPPLTGTNPIAVAVPSSDGRPFVADVSMGAVTHGDVLLGKARPEELVPFGGPQAHKAFALAAAVELLVGALAGPEHGAIVLAAHPAHDPVPAFRSLASGLRLPGDRWTVG
jgi:LDH2 family malate/lactate/ureidoglycolate dehydrogenase